MSKSKRVFIIHGWSGHTEEGVEALAKERVRKKGF